MAVTHELTPAHTWVDTHGDYLYTMALYRVRDEEIAQDLVQETFMAALKSQKNFKGRSTEKNLAHKYTEAQGD